ncbi:MAG: hypothetical protein Q9165_000853 [Trypethelium subeluteriae]
MASSNADFDVILDQFMHEYPARSALTEVHLKRIRDMLNLPSGLAKDGLKFQPVIIRTKTVSSAMESLKRRQTGRMERQKLKERMESPELKGDWERYWRERNQPYMISDYGPFRDYEAMFDALHDIGGARVLVYFPGDVERVVNILREHQDIKVVRILRRGQGIAPEMLALERYVNGLEQKPDREKMPENMFPGYRATHVHVQLKGEAADAIAKTRSEPKSPVVIEIQIEHDIIYKPTGTIPTDEEKRILDTFNGIVMTGESALSVLEASFQRKEEARIKDTEAFAVGLYDLGKWMEAHCADKNIHPLRNKRSQAWEYLNRLLDVLQAAEEHTSGKLRVLINHLSERGVDDVVFGCSLPLFLMKQRCEDEPKPITETTFEDRSQATMQSARFLALRVVHSLNMAAYLGIENEFLQTIGKSMSEDFMRPSMIDFLDILHPQHPRLDWKTEDVIIKFCENFLDRKKLRTVLPETDSLARVLMELPTMLVEIGRVAYPHEDSQEENVIIQRSLCTLLSDCEHAHWVPELCYEASDWRHQSDEEIHFLREVSDPSEGRVVAPLRFPAESSISATNTRRRLSSTVRDQDLGYLTKVTHRRFVGDFRLKFQSGGKPPATWWELQFADGNKFIKEYHADKQARRPRAHPGQFKALLGDSSSTPKWKYTIAKPKEWKIKKVKIVHENSESPIKKISRQSEFVDLATALIPLGNSNFSVIRQGDTSEYELRIEDTKYRLQSLETQFVLRKETQATARDSVAQRSTWSDTREITGLPHNESSMIDSVERPIDVYSGHAPGFFTQRHGIAESQAMVLGRVEEETGSQTEDVQTVSRSRSRDGTESQVRKKTPQTAELHFEVTEPDAEETNAAMAIDYRGSESVEYDHRLHWSTVTEILRKESQSLHVRADKGRAATKTEGGRRVPGEATDVDENARIDKGYGRKRRRLASNPRENEET